MPACDPNFDDVSLLMHLQSNFADSSNNDYVFALLGSPVFDSTQKAFGTASYSNNQTDNYGQIEITADGPLDLSLGDFTIEFWVYMDYVNDNVMIDWCQNLPRDIASGMWFEQAGFADDQPPNINWYLCNGYNSTQTVGTSTAINTPGWYPVAFQRNGSNVEVYVSGALVDTQAFDPTINLNMPTNPYVVIGGAYADWGAPMSCWIQELRVTKGLARYNSGGYAPIDGEFGTACTVLIPNVVNTPLATAETTLTTANLTVGAVTTEYDGLIASGNIVAQTPVAGTLVGYGTSVALLESLGPPPTAIMPEVIGMTLYEATAAVEFVGLTVSSVPVAPSRTARIGTIISSTPPPGTDVVLGESVSLVECIGKPPWPVPFSFEQTVISQYANSPTILQLVKNMDTYINQKTNFANFFNYVWNVLSAKGFGLDIWGKIVGVSRLLTIPATVVNFGFEDDAVPYDYAPFNQAPFYTGAPATQTYALPDSEYLPLILAKALANISAMTAPALNQLLQNLFGVGSAYVLDRGNMQMSLVFNFTLTPIQYAIVTQSGAIPHPAAVQVSIGQPVPPLTFGFQEQGAGVETFNNGTFNSG
jgi:hypothetical protein